MRKMTLLRITTLAVGIFMMTGNAIAENFKWRLQVYEPKTAITAKLLQTVADQVRKRTDGALDISLFQPGVLGYSGWGVHRVVSKNQLEMAEGITAAMTEVPEYAIFDQPIFANIGEAEVAWNLVKSDLDKAAQSKMGLKLLSGVAKPMGYWVSKKPMSTTDDIKGMKMRAWNLPLSKWVERMGGVPYSIPFAELYTSMAAGVVEANAMAPVTVLEKKLNEVAGYYNMWPSGTVVFATFVNLEKFNALPVKIQNILMEEANKAEKENWKLQAVATAPAIEKMKELGMEIVQPSEDQLAKALAVDKAIYNEWLEEAPADVKILAKRVLTELGK